jgi:hypothetical protein
LERWTWRRTWPRHSVATSASSANVISSRWSRVFSPLIRGAPSHMRIAATFSAVSPCRRSIARLPFDLHLGALTWINAPSWLSHRAAEPRLSLSGGNGWPPPKAYSFPGGGRLIGTLKDQGPHLYVALRYLFVN